MRIWDVPPECLCRQHLLGEHRELHAIWTILTTGKTGYTRHPEFDFGRRAMLGGRRASNNSRANARSLVP